MSKPDSKTLMLIKLERKQLEVERLHAKLDSYQCAPKTYPHFEIKENLKSELARFTNSTEQLKNTLKNLDITVNNYIGDFTEKFEAFNEIHQEVTDYLDVVRY